MPSVSEFDLSAVSRLLSNQGQGPCIDYALWQLRCRFDSSLFVLFSGAGFRLRALPALQGRPLRQCTAAARQGYCCLPYKLARVSVSTIWFPFFSFFLVCACFSLCLFLAIPLSTFSQFVFCNAAAGQLNLCTSTSYCCLASSSLCVCVCVCVFLWMQFTLFLCAAILGCVFTCRETRL